MQKKIYLLYGTTVIMLFLIGLMMWYQQTPSKKDQVSNFEECLKANNLVLESHPRQCRTPNGKVFIEKVSINPTSDFQKPVENAKPNHLQATPTSSQHPVSATPAQREDLCKNLCGDGVCEEIVCMGTGCACAESALTCPSDCKK